MMPTGHASNENASKRTHGTLLDRMDAHLDVLVELRELLRLKKSPPRGDNSFGESELGSALLRLVDVVDRMFKTRPADSGALAGLSEQKLARVLLLSGVGSRFEPAILMSIREYRSAHDNVSRYATATLPEPLKADILARFRQQLDGVRQTLQLLEVIPFEPEAGQLVEPGRHRVVRTVVSDTPEHVNRIAKVVSPGFDWMNEQGLPAVEPATVLAFVLRQESADGSPAQPAAKRSPDSGSKSTSGLATSRTVQPRSSKR
jgi:hypothetical protein